MQFWFARGSEVSIREQLVTQVVLGILSDDLAPGQRLPARGDLARRFHVHPNTVSAGYRQLERERWVEFRRGSGVYVRASKPETSATPALALDQTIARLFRAAQKLGVSLPALRSAPAAVAGDAASRTIFCSLSRMKSCGAFLAAEIARAVTLPVESCSPQDCSKNQEGGIPVVLPNRAAAVRKLLPAGTELLTLQVRSVPASLAAFLPAPSGALVGVASRWPEFLKVARAVLNAAGFHPDSLVFRDAREANWQRGLKQTAAVVCNFLTAADLPPGCRAIPFSLLSESSIAELRRYEAFIRQPIVP